MEKEKEDVHTFKRFLLLNSEAFASFLEIKKKNNSCSLIEHGWNNLRGK